MRLWKFPAANRSMDYHLDSNIWVSQACKIRVAPIQLLNFQPDSGVSNPAYVIFFRNSKANMVTQKHSQQQNEEK